MGDDSVYASAWGPEHQVGWGLGVLLPASSFSLLASGFSPLGSGFCYGVATGVTSAVGLMA